MGRTCQKSNNEASLGRKRVNKRSRVKQKGQQQVAGGNTKSIHDNPSTEDDIIPMRQLFHNCRLKRQSQIPKCRSVTCNRASGNTKRVQRTTQVTQETKRATMNAYSIRMHMEFLIQLQIASSTRTFLQISCPRYSMQRRSSS